MKPGSVSFSERVPPPMLGAASMTSTDLPARAKVIAAARPFGPDPITIASYELSIDCDIELPYSRIVWFAAKRTTLSDDRTPNATFEWRLEGKRRIADEQAQMNKFQERATGLEPATSSLGS